MSLPKLVEEHAQTLRTRYLAWIHELGEAPIRDKRLLDHLELRPGFSYWWMTLLVEKSYGKSTRLHDAARLLALEDLARESATRRITLVSRDRVLATAFRRWCHNAGIWFEWKPSQERGGRPSVRGLYRSLPYVAQAAVSLVRYLWPRWPLRNSCQALDGSTTADITFVDYLAHLDRSALLTGHFGSNYWTALPGSLVQAKKRVNWLHLYVQHDAVQTPKQAGELIAQFNRSGGGFESHAMLDGALGVRVVLAVLRDYARLAWRGSSLSEVKLHFRMAGSNVDLWPLLERDWRNSMRGPGAMWNLLALNLLEKTLSRLSRQRMGVYLQENQGWEMAFIHAWRAAGHGCLIGVQHGTVRYWDLRYFFDARSYARSGRNDLPLPDKVALNGPAAVAAYRDGAYPEDQVVELEALRYLYLMTQGDARTQAPGVSPALRVLVCGDILPAVSQQMMEWLERAASDLPANTRYTVKPHPACAIRAGDYPAVSLQMTDAPLSELFANCDVVFASNITSAAVDAYCSGTPVVQVLDGSAFNMSPLRGLAGVVYVSNPAELADALRDARSRERVVAGPYFRLDKGLPRWRTLLGLQPADAEQSVLT